MKKYYLIELREIDYPVLVSINAVSRKTLRYYLDEYDAIEFIADWYFCQRVSQILKKSNKRNDIDTSVVIELKNFYVSKDGIDIFKEHKKNVSDKD